MKGETELLLQPMHFVIHDLLLFLEGKSKMMVLVYEEAKE